MLKLIPFWITFPVDKLPILGFGVTAFTIEDAYSILEEYGYNYHQIAKRVAVKKDITWDEIEADHVRPNIGPITVRGIWFPHLNSR